MIEFKFETMEARDRFLDALPNRGPYADGSVPGVTTSCSNVVSVFLNTVKITPPGRGWSPDSHWEEHPEHSRYDWFQEVASDSTRLSYADWVNSKIEQEAEACG